MFHHHFTQNKHKIFLFPNQCEQSPDGRIEVKGQHIRSSSLHIKDVDLSDSGNTTVKLQVGWRAPKEHVP